MERLTTDKPAGEMSMMELAYNCCYIEDGEARYRDFEMDINAKDFVWELTVAHKDNTLGLPSDEELFDMQMEDDLQYGPEIMDGFIALFYRNLWAMAELRERLKPYEDLEITAEQVKELQKQIPPCKVGDIVWDNDLGKPCSYEVTGFSYGDLGDSFDDDLGVYDQIVVYYKSFSGGIKGSFAVSEIGKSVFLSKEAAEQALKEMQK